jgi:hypothetical protein
MNARATTNMHVKLITAAVQALRILPLVFVSEYMVVSCKKVVGYRFTAWGPSFIACGLQASEATLTFEPQEILREF